MADAFKLATVTASIAALNISVVKPDGTTGNLSILDTGAIPESVNQQDCPVLMPRPVDFVTGFGFTRDTYGADAARKSVAYTLNYRLLYAPALQGSSVFEKYGAMVDCAVAVLLYLGTHTDLAGTTDILPSDVPTFGPQFDMAGTRFHGCDISLAVEQYLET